ncbi:MAG: hypothetical protein ABFD97_04845 [Syntrophobacter sp.]
MILSPPILALLSGSFLVVLILLYATWYGLQIIRHWDIRSGSELQISLERRTYLISTIMSHALGFQLLSLFLFIYTADQLSSSFTGAMCAAGALNVNRFGYPALLLKILNFMAGGVWLVINATDNSAPDYPLIRKKYMFLLPIGVLITIEAFLQGCYFLGLKPDIITSCCGTLFSSAADDSGALAAPPRYWPAAGYYFFAFLTLGTGALFYTRQKGAYLFSLSSTFLFLFSCLALVFYISPYLYELPTHHCPFCILHREYTFVGYPVYLLFLAGGVSGLGVGAISPFTGVRSLRETLPRIRAELTAVCLISWSAALVISSWAILTSNLKMD